MLHACISCLKGPQIVVWVAAMVDLQGMHVRDPPFVIKQVAVFGHCPGSKLRWSRCILWFKIPSVLLQTSLVPCLPHYAALSFWMICVESESGPGSRAVCVVCCIGTWWLGWTLTLAYFGYSQCPLWSQCADVVKWVFWLWLMRIQIVALAFAFSVCEYELFIGSCSP